MRIGDKYSRVRPAFMFPLAVAFSVAVCLLAGLVWFPLVLLIVIGPALGWWMGGK